MLLSIPSWFPTVVLFTTVHSLNPNTILIQDTLVNVLLQTITTFTKSKLRKLYIKMKATFFSIAALAMGVMAKTDLEGCTSSETVAFGGASMVYWDPTNGEICSFLDCGGGRAPPKTTVPGCAAYEGTATYTPDYLPGWGSATATTEASEAEETVTVSSAGESVPAYETKTASAESTLVTSKAVLPSGTASSAVQGLSGYVTGLTTKGGNSTASIGTPTASVPVEATGAASNLVANGFLLAGVFGLAMF